MHRFEVLANSEVIGHSELEYGDPPMGVVFGKFLPQASYGHVQEAIVRDEGRQLEGICLAVRATETGQVIESEAGVHIADHSAELGQDEIEVTVLGIPYPLYAELFPQHVEAYDKQFK